MSVSLKTKIEGILFVSADEGVSVTQLSELFSVSEEVILEQLFLIKEAHQNSESALVLVDYANKYHFTTKSECYESIAAYLKIHKMKQLSQSALETLTIVAYKQPITRIEIEEIRGVSSEVTMRKLLALDLIQEAGRLDTPGRPILYQVTDVFLDLFKLVSLDELPEIKQQMEFQEDLF